MFEPFSTEEIINNYNKLRKAIDVTFKSNEDRLNTINSMFNHFEERMSYCPASSFAHFHNSFPGGFVDHTLRVAQFSTKFLKLYSELGFDTSDITKESLLFCAFIHDIGKLGTVDEELYMFNPSDWHVKNQGKNYILNPKIQYMDINTRTSFLLNHFNIKCTEQEWLGIKLMDGLYNEDNKKYYVRFDDDQSIKSMLPYILNQAKISAVRFEYNRWKNNG
jgi:hypothetical protein